MINVLSIWEVVCWYELYKDGILGRVIWMLYGDGENI